MKDWSEIEVQMQDGSIKPQSFMGNQEQIRMIFNGEVPSPGAASVIFDIGGTIYHFKGQLKCTEVESEFKPVEFYKEEKRKFIRIPIPESYPAVLSVQTLSAQEISVDAKLIDLSSNGGQIKFPSSPELKVGSQIEGVIQIGSCPEIKVAARVRYVEKNQGHQIAGLEFRHLEYDSNDKVHEALYFLKREIA
jgi:c-di-GMP-binding flagellar brake protein YcgR